MTTDLLALDAQLSEEDRMIRDTVRKFGEDNIRPHIASWFDAGTLPRELAQEFGKLGLLGMHLTGYGCAGSTAVQYGLVCHELEAIDSGVRSLVSVQGSLAMFAIQGAATRLTQTGPVGVYSNVSMWQTITGVGFTPVGIDADWETAGGQCSNPGFTASPVWLVQSVAGGVDSDLAC